jgi:putative membrane protein
MLWIKAFHIIFVVCWFAGLFYLPRIFVYTAMSSDQNTKQQLLVMAGKLYRFTTPIAILAIIFGIWLIFLNPDYYLNALWMQIKLFLITLLIIYHWYSGQLLKQLINNSGKSHVYYRWFNEMPVLILLAVVILAVVRPFS